MASLIINQFFPRLSQIISIVRKVKLHPFLPNISFWHLLKTKYFQGVRLFFRIIYNALVSFFDILQKGVTKIDPWDRVFKNGPSKLCGREPLKIWRGGRFKDCLPQVLFGPFLNTVYQIRVFESTLNKLKYKKFMKKNPKIEEYHFTIQASLFAVRILTLSSPPE